MLLSVQKSDDLDDGSAKEMLGPADERDEFIGVHQEEGDQPDGRKQ
jgi:hypothetical protein